MIFVKPDSTVDYKALETSTELKARTGLTWEVIATQGCSLRDALFKFENSLRKIMGNFYTGEQTLVVTVDDTVSLHLKLDADLSKVELSSVAPTLMLPSQDI